jgi:monovalent cation:H+ antiporter-2, CPA2 family
MLETSLLLTIIASITGAFLAGLLAVKLKLPAITGYLLAGMLIGPHTPGYVGEVKLAKQLAEIGVILLMFSVGLHFSIKELLRVRRIAVPGALVQMGAATGAGAAVAMAFGYPLFTGLVYGFSLSVASTVVLLRILEEHNALQAPAGSTAVGWLIVEDIAMVMALVMLPFIATAATSEQGMPLSVFVLEGVAVLLQVGGFALLMLVAGRKVLPWLLEAVEKTGSDELITLAALAIALGFAWLAYEVFDTSFALGAFLAGLVLNESAAGHRSAEHTQSLREMFSALFFVSVGMLFNPAILVEEPAFVAMTVFIIVCVKSLAALLILRLFRQPGAVSLPVAVSLAQIGEFSFILAGAALALGLMPQNIHHVVLAGAVLSITLNPFLFKIVARLAPPAAGPR